MSGEIGKSIVFAVSQGHAAKLAQILNQMADRMFPGKYQSDFAVQVTSQVDNAQQHTINFTNNNLLGSANFIPSYKTSKARVCVTVGMMTTGYDCPDICSPARACLSSISSIAWKAVTVWRLSSISFPLSAEIKRLLL